MDSDIAAIRGARLEQLRLKYPSGRSSRVMVECPANGDLFDAADSAERETRWGDYNELERWQFLRIVVQRAHSSIELTDWTSHRKLEMLAELDRKANWDGILAHCVFINDYFNETLAPGELADAFVNKLSSELPALGYTIAHSSESRRLGIDVSVPEMTELLPSESDLRRWKTERERQREYRRILAETALGLIAVAFKLTAEDKVESILLNLNLTAVNTATGHEQTLCVTSVQVSRVEIASLNLNRVEPIACLRSLHAVVQRGEGDVEPIRPLAEVRSLDPRFVEASDVLSDLDSRPNLMELTPGEFESLIQNLFTAMGLDTHQTQASRDGGVDAVAFDERPVLGGKVIIQAKRYKNTVGVSAVRDLYGALLNEGASKGILVTTSGYGAASFDFSRNKPLELLDGSNLLFLLKEHAGIEAKIEVPPAWVEPLHESG